MNPSAGKLKDLFSPDFRRQKTLDSYAIFLISKIGINIIQISTHPLWGRKKNRIPLTAKEIENLLYDAIMVVGYHTRDYFTSRWDRFSRHPLAALAHSTHVKGAGKMENGREIPRITVILATGILKAISEKFFIS